MKHLRKQQKGKIGLSQACHISGLRSGDILELIHRGFLPAERISDRWYFPNIECLRSLKLKREYYSDLVREVEG